MSSRLNVPFIPANTWDVEQLRDFGQLQRMFENRGEIDAEVPYYSINYDSQRSGKPLPAPYDPPGYETCTNGPTKCTNGHFCVTNVVSREVPSCDFNDQPTRAIPVCMPGLTPQIIGCVKSPDGPGYRAQMQCLPSWKTNQRRMSPAKMNT